MLPKLSGKSSFFCYLLTYFLTMPHNDHTPEVVCWLFILFDLSWLTPICYCSCVTDALKVFNDRRIVRPLYCTIAPTMRTAFAINRQTTYFLHTFNGYPIFVLCLVCRPSPNSLNPTLFCFMPTPAPDSSTANAVIFLSSPFPHPSII